MSLSIVMGRYLKGISQQAPWLMTGGLSPTFWCTVKAHGDSEFLHSHDITTTAKIPTTVYPHSYPMNIPIQISHFFNPHDIHGGEPPIFRARAFRQAIINQKIELVLTAHPTEAQRRSALKKHEQMLQQLKALDGWSKMGCIAGENGEILGITLFLMAVFMFLFFKSGKELSSEQKPCLLITIEYNREFYYMVPPSYKLIYNPIST